MHFQNTKNIKKIFNNISQKYDLLNTLLSFGLHFSWKKRLIIMLNPKNGEKWADLCCGTGDISILINKMVCPEGSVLGIDNASNILEVAKNKSKYINNHVITWKKKDVFELNEFHYKFDGICMSYGLRNLKDVENGIKKVYSLLNDNGKAGFLDFNHSSENSIPAFFQKIYLRFIVVPIAGIFKLQNEYSYIEKSINNFPSGSDLISIAMKSGFKSSYYKEICFGQMGILILNK